ncbi:MAG: hypothetical protein LBG72_01825 [Spirochaetaceae bacterium]|jgi:hypothetical protein|nr:hypothetical protein [Spirochaetaceae bacterium]
MKTKAYNLFNSTFPAFSIAVFLVIASIIAATAASCVYVDSLEEINAENYFWVEIDQKETRTAYSIIRVAVIDGEGAQLASATGPFEGKYKIVPPPDYTAENLNFLIELNTLYPQELKLISNKPMAREYLNSRYVRLEKPFPQAGETVSLALPVSALRVGHSFGGLSPSEIPNMPDFFDLAVQWDDPGIEALLNSGYTPLYAVALAKESDGTNASLKLNFTKSPPVNEDEIIGIASPDTGWYMLIYKDDYHQDEYLAEMGCRFWVFFMRNNDASGLRVYYQDGQTPEKGGVLDPPLRPMFAGIPLNDVAVLTVLSKSDNERKGTPYEDLGEMYILTNRNYYIENTIEWHPIGRDPLTTTGAGYSAFSGIFDGAGYNVAFYGGLTKGAGVHNYTGLFGFANSATFRNLRLTIEEEDLQITDNGSNNAAFDGDDIATGLLVGSARGCTIENIRATGTRLKVTRTSNGGNIVGGIIGIKTGGPALKDVNSSILTVTGSGGTVVAGPITGRSL